MNKHILHFLSNWQVIKLGAYEEEKSRIKQSLLMSPFISEF